MSLIQKFAIIASILVGPLMFCWEEAQAADNSKTPAKVDVITICYARQTFVSDPASWPRVQGMRTATKAASARWPSSKWVVFPKRHWHLASGNQP